MSKFISFIKKNDLEIASGILFSIFLIMYLLNSSSNVPIMDYWQYLNSLVEKSFLGGVSFSDLNTNNGIHKSPVQLFLFLVNVHLFSWNTQLGVFLALIPKLITALIFCRMLKTLSNSLIYKISCLMCFLILYSLANYEILTLEFSLSFEIRFLSFISTFYFFNKLYKNDEVICISFLLFLLFTIIFIGGAYSFALGFSIIFVVCIDFYINKSKNLNKSIIFLSTIIIGFILYLYDINFNQNNGVRIEKSFNIFYRFIKGVFVICGTSIIGSGKNLYSIIFCGLCIIFIHLFFFIKYIKNRIYEKNYIPLLCWFYSALFYGEIFLGRSGFGIGYLASSRYVADAAVAIFADVITVMYIFDDKNDNFKINRLVSIISFSFFTFCILFCNVNELKISKYRKLYNDDLIQKMIFMDSYDDSDLLQFQAANPKLVRVGVEIMKNYSLGIFSKKISENYLVSNRLGVYDDGWLSGKSVFHVKNTNSSFLFLSFYNPSSDINGETVDIYVDDTLFSQIPVHSGNWDVKVPVEKNKIHKIVLKTNYRQEISNGDSRNLSLILSNVKLLENN